jgi:histone deacetylase complex regulatory component SIN3
LEQSEQPKGKAMSTVEEKLLKFQFVCEDKLRKIELLKQTHEKNEKILETYADNYEQQTELAQLSLTLAEIKLKICKAGVLLSCQVWSSLIQ